MKNQEIKRFSNIIIYVNTIILFITFLVFMILKMYSWALGYLIGSLTSYVTYLMHVNNVNNISEDTKSPMKMAIKSTMLRLLVSAIPLAIALFFDWINIIATFIGLLTIKVIIMVIAIVLESKKSKIKEGGTV